MKLRAILLGLSRWPAVLYTHREHLDKINMPSRHLHEWKNMLVRASFERPALEESLIDAIFDDNSLSTIERRDLQQDIRYSFYSADTEPEVAQSHLGQMIETLSFEQEFDPKLAQLTAELYARGGDDNVSEDEWQEHLRILSIQRQHIEQMMPVSADD